MKNADFRSDTVTLPTPSMLKAMMDAPLGDDVFQEDPTVNALEAYAADLFGKESALFCASGTQTNQIAIMAHTSPGGEVICHAESHIYKYEGGGIARNSQCSMKLVQGNLGRILPNQLESCLNNPKDVHLPLTQLVSVEDTANRGGGAVYKIEDLRDIQKFCATKGLPLHLDGARIFNALAVNGMNTKTYGQMFDSISLCLSKGLGAPVGSLLLGTESFIEKARRFRKVLGGGMRQAGILAAAGIYALENNISRLHEDHRRAKLLGETLVMQSWVQEIFPVETNIVVAVLHKEDQRDLVQQQLMDLGIACIAFGPGMLRFVTHLNIDDEALEKAILAIKSIGKL
ncbi:MAG: aminotransferase class I/II-fold pyridoxal phosphate-dependent enzyme [Bacteroidetes bacterium]|nr:aminotransferase class I/II-fold pyridoxal phosphate-dependent enzyme [Bacteroidota bacterium]MBM3425205.1 aminotransferase class I/II-fold pyridoxal phosphate-dependent enzyme [Bacteroidota bacterium]